MFRLVEWIIAPQIIDLTLKESGEIFQPPEDTTLIPISDEIPPDPLALILNNASYSRYGDLVHFLIML